jgi:hypothetical protein
MFWNFFEKANKSASPNRLPKNCIPNGKPAELLPAGREIAGIPANEAWTVKMSAR